LFFSAEKALRNAAHDEVARALDAAAQLSKKRKPMTADEKAKQSRDRNREHARNTRLRKKAYIQKLKELSDQLVHEKESYELERKAFAEVLYNNYFYHKNILFQFFSLRSENSRDRAQWETILAEEVVMVLPISLYQYFHKGEVKSQPGNQQIRVVVGIDAVMRDCQSLTCLLEMIGSGTPAWNQVILSRGMVVSSNSNDSAMVLPPMNRMIYHFSKEDTLSAGNKVMSRFFASLESPLLTNNTNNATTGGVDTNIMKNIMVFGMVSCELNPQTKKIVSLEMIFDGMNCLQQLQVSEQPFFVCCLCRYYFFVCSFVW
jgi:hypothetical protein